MAIEMHAMHGDRYDHIMTIHRDSSDHGPLQMVSAEKVKEWMQKEVDYDALMARLETSEKTELK